MADFFSKYLFFDERRQFSFPYSRPKPKGGIENVSPLEYRVIFGHSCDELCQIAMKIQHMRCAGCGASCKTTYTPFISWHIDEAHSIITPAHFHLLCINCMNFLHHGYMKKSYDYVRMEFRQRSSLIAHNIGQHYYWPYDNLKISKDYSFWVQQNCVMNRLAKNWQVKSVLPQMAKEYPLSSSQIIESITAEKMILFIRNHCAEQTSNIAFALLPSGGKNLPAIEISQSSLTQWLHIIHPKTAFKLIGENINNSNCLTLVVV